MPLESQEIATLALVFGAFVYLARLAYSNFFPANGDAPKSGCGSCGSSGSCSSKGNLAVEIGPKVVTIGGKSAPPKRPS